MSLKTGDPCPECESSLNAIVFALYCPACGWNNAKRVNA